VRSTGTVKTPSVYDWSLLVLEAEHGLTMDATYDREAPEWIWCKRMEVLKALKTTIALPFTWNALRHLSASSNPPSGSRTAEWEESKFVVGNRRLRVVESNRSNLELMALSESSVSFRAWWSLLAMFSRPVWLGKRHQIL